MSYSNKPSAVKICWSKSLARVYTKLEEYVASGTLLPDEPGAYIATVVVVIQRNTYGETWRSGFEAWAPAKAGYLSDILKNDASVLAGNVVGQIKNRRIISITRKKLKGT